MAAKLKDNELRRIQYVKTHKKVYQEEAKDEMKTVGQKIAFHVFIPRIEHEMKWNRE